MHISTSIDDYREAAFDGRPGRLRGLAKLAFLAGLNRVPYSDVLDALDADEVWTGGRGPAVVRASAIAEVACESEYRRGQIARARNAVTAHVSATGHAHASVLIEIAAEATHAADGLVSQIINPEDLTLIVGEFADIAECWPDDGAGLADRCALREADEALRYFHSRAIAQDAEGGGDGDAIEAEEGIRPLREDVGRMIERLADAEGPLAREASFALRRLFAGVPHPDDGAPLPVDLWQHYEAPLLPRNVLPDVIERFAIQQGAIMGADPAGLAMSALAVCASAIPDTISLQMKLHDLSWREHPRLWVGLVGAPSTKKSPIISSALRPLTRLDRDLAERNEIAMRAFMALPKNERNDAATPAQPQFIVEDTSVEALQEVLKHSPKGVLIKQDELSGWFGSMDRYNTSKGADRAFYLQAYNGGPYRVNRVTRGAAYIPNLSACLLGGIQPEPLRKAVGDSADDGLIQRVLPVVLRSATAGRDIPNVAVVGEYEALIQRLTKISPPGGNLSSTPVKFSSEARAIRERLEYEHAELVRAIETISPKLASHFGKHDGLFGRLALLWHCVEHYDGALPAEISKESAERVARFMTDYLRPSAVAFYAGLLGMEAGHETLIALAAYIVSEGLTEVSIRNLARATRELRALTGDEGRRLCEKLESFGWLERTDPPTRSNSPRWRVNPAVHALYADRGRQESERRAAGRAAIAAALAGGHGI